MRRSLYLFSEPWKLLLRLLGWPLRAVANAPLSEREMAQWETDMLNRDGPESERRRGALPVIAIIAFAALLVWLMPSHRAELLAGQKIDWPNPRQ